VGSSYPGEGAGDGGDGEREGGCGTHRKTSCGRAATAPVAFLLLVKFNGQVEKS